MSYCGAKCQRSHWKTHKNVCGKAKTTTETNFEPKSDIITDQNGRDSVQNRVDAAQGGAGSNVSECFADGCTNEGTLNCSQCKCVSYCGAKCQRSHWKTHKNVCGKAKIATETNFEPKSDIITDQNGHDSVQNRVDAAQGGAGSNVSECFADGCTNEGTLNCSQCKCVSYCGAKCQRSHWKTHKNVCGKAKTTTETNFEPKSDIITDQNGHDSVQNRVDAAQGGADPAQSGAGSNVSECFADDCTNEGKINCSRCKCVSYCGAKCQRSHWKTHKNVCGKAKTTTETNFEPKSYIVTGQNGRDSVQNRVDAAQGGAGSNVSECFADGCTNEGTLNCSQCKCVSYCGAKCQRSHWKTHKNVCGKAKIATETNYESEDDAELFDMSLLTESQGPAAAHERERIVYRFLLSWAVRIDDIFSETGVRVGPYTTEIEHISKHTIKAFMEYTEIALRIGILPDWWVSSGVYRPSMANFVVDAELVRENHGEYELLLARKKSVEILGPVGGEDIFKYFYDLMGQMLEGSECENCSAMMDDDCPNRLCEECCSGCSAHILCISCDHFRGEGCKRNKCFVCCKDKKCLHDRKIEVGRRRLVSDAKAEFDKRKPTPVQGKKTLPSGTLVILFGLKSKPQLNGSSGTVINYNSTKDRYAIKVKDETYLFKVCNFEVNQKSVSNSKNIKCSTKKCKHHASTACDFQSCKSHCPAVTNDSKKCSHHTQKEGLCTDCGKRNADTKCHRTCCQNCCIGCKFHGYKLCSCEERAAIDCPNQKCSSCCTGCVRHGSCQGCERRPDAKCRSNLCDKCCTGCSVHPVCRCRKRAQAGCRYNSCHRCCRGCKLPTHPDPIKEEEQSEIKEEEEEEEEMPTLVSRPPAEKILLPPPEDLGTFEGVLFESLQNIFAEKKFEKLKPKNCSKDFRHRLEIEVRTDHTYAYFVCDCGNVWSSERTIVTYMCSYEFEIGGRISIKKEFAQGCQMCEQMCTPQFSPSAPKCLNDAKISATKLANEILRVFYNVSNLELPNKPWTQGSGKPHDKSRCEACQEGVCLKHGDCTSTHEQKKEQQWRGRKNRRQENPVNRPIMWSFKVGSEYVPLFSKKSKPVDSPDVPIPSEVSMEPHDWWSGNNNSKHKNSFHQSAGRSSAAGNSFHQSAGRSSAAGNSFHQSAGRSSAAGNSFHQSAGRSSAAGNSFHQSAGRCDLPPKRGGGQPQMTNTLQDMLSQMSPKN